MSTPKESPMPNKKSYDAFSLAKWDAENSEETFHTIYQFLNFSPASNSGPGPGPSSNPLPVLTDLRFDCDQYFPESRNSFEKRVEEGAKLQAPTWSKLEKFGANALTEVERSTIFDRPDYGIIQWQRKRGMMMNPLTGDFHMTIPRETTSTSSMTSSGLARPIQASTLNADEPPNASLQRSPIQSLNSGETLTPSMTALQSPVSNPTDVAGVKSRRQRQSSVANRAKKTTETSTSSRARQHQTPIPNPKLDAQEPPIVQKSTPVAVLPFDLNLKQPEEKEELQLQQLLVKLKQDEERRKQWKRQTSAHSTDKKPPPSKRPRKKTASPDAAAEAADLDSPIAKRERKQQFLEQEKAKNEEKKEERNAAMMSVAEKFKNKPVTVFRNASDNEKPRQEVQQPAKSPLIANPLRIHELKRGMRPSMPNQMAKRAFPSLLAGQLIKPHLNIPSAKRPFPSPLSGPGPPPVKRPCQEERQESKSDPAAQAAATPTPAAATTAAPTPEAVVPDDDVLAATVAAVAAAGAAAAVDADLRAFKLDHGWYSRNCAWPLRRVDPVPVRFVPPLVNTTKVLLAPPLLKDPMERQVKETRKATPRQMKSTANLPDPLAVDTSQMYFCPAPRRKDRGMAKQKSEQPKRVRKVNVLVPAPRQSRAKPKKPAGTNGQKDSFSYATNQVPSAIPESEPLEIDNVDDFFDLNAIDESDDATSRASSDDPNGNSNDGILVDAPEAEYEQIVATVSEKEFSAEFERFGSGSLSSLLSFN